MADKKKPRRKIKVWSIVVWLIIWQICAMIIGQNILLVSPVTAFQRMFQLAATGPFWISVSFSLLRIISGFLAACIMGVVLAALSAKFKRVEELLAPIMLTIKAVPVASFIILILIWIPSKNLSIIISFLIVVPVIYTNMKDGIASCNKQLLEMADLFRISPARKIRYIYVTQIMPFFRAACSISLGLCWKSGVAAEVIGIPKNSIGENLYNAKIYLDTPDLFAWTVVIIIISLVFEKLFIYLLDKGINRLERI